MIINIEKYIDTPLLFLSNIQIFEMKILLVSNDYFQ